MTVFITEIRTAVWCEMIGKQNQRVTRKLLCRLHRLLYPVNKLFAVLSVTQRIRFCSAEGSHLYSQPFTGLFYAFQILIIPAPEFYRFKSSHADSFDLFTVIHTRIYCLNINCKIVHTDIPFLIFTHFSPNCRTWNPAYRIPCSSLFLRSAITWGYSLSSLYSRQRITIMTEKMIGAYIHIPLIMAIALSFCVAAKPS